MPKSRYGWMTDAELTRQSQDPNTPADDRRDMIDELLQRGGRPASARAGEQPVPRSSGTSAPTPMVITGVNMPFSEMVALLVKIAFASIPATIIVGVTLALIWVAVLAIIGQMRH